ncbi:AmmeMemoRadiSam system protein B [Candidatus Poribacteria bacterium]|nr:AmmeMemoRadiSam system protein B [Candidatus Poribacteria bacterium]
MSKKIFRILLVSAVLLVGCGRRDHGDLGAEPQTPPSSKSVETPGVIRPSVAGSFYPANADALKGDIARYLKSADLPETKGEIIAAVVPHAGYVYSGPVAAYAYKAIAQQAAAQGKSAEGKAKLDAVVVLAFNHRGMGQGVSVYYSGAMETPLGKKAVNERVAREFMGSDPGISFTRGAFEGEHSAEVQIPFIQTALPDVPIVPVVFSQQSIENVEVVERGLERIAKANRILVLASTDLSHYHPYEEANSLDGRIVKQILEGSPRTMAQFLNEHYEDMRGPCGVGPVLAVLSFAESQGAEPVLLKYANSGDTFGDKDAVVGYASIVFMKKPAHDPLKSDRQTPGASNTPNKSGSYSLSDGDKKTLLGLARRSLEAFVRDGRILKADPPESEILLKDGAAFVTLNKNGQLRGCIGQMQATMPLYQTVIRMAVAAASEDPRFSPVKPEELKDVHIEISVNSPLRPVSSPDEIVLGKHGVVVAKGFRQGVFLPQVATETGWTKEEFLRNLCAHKAGLPPDAYMHGARLYVFTSIVFEEEKGHS